MMKKKRTQDYIMVRQECVAEEVTTQDIERHSDHSSAMGSDKEKQQVNGQVTSSFVSFEHHPQDKTGEGTEWDYWRYLEIFCSEFLGTGLLMAVGCMGTVTGFSNGTINQLQPGFTFGLIVATLIQIFGHISAAHFNPAVTVCFYMLGHVTSVTQVTVYLMAEVLGATAGLSLLKLLTPMEEQCLCCTLPHTSLNEFQSLGVEAVATSCLILLVCALTDPRNQDKQDSAPIKFGLLIVALSFAAGPYTGASMNPARSLAPAIVNNVWTAQWVYWLGPLVPGFIVPLFYRTIFCKNINR